MWAGSMVEMDGCMMKGWFPSASRVLMKEVKTADWRRLVREHSNLLFVGPTKFSTRSSTWIWSSSFGSGLMKPG